MAEVLKQVPEQQKENQVGEDYPLQESITLPTHGRTLELDRQKELDYLNGVAHSDSEINRSGFDSSQKETKKTVTGRSLEILLESKQPMTIGEIWKVFLENEDFQEIDQNSVRSSLIYLYRHGKIRRLTEGTYASSEFEVEKYLSPKTIRQRILEAFNDTKRPMKAADILQYLNEDGITRAESTMIVSILDVRRHLERMHKRGEIKRLIPRVYSYLEFNGGEDEIPKSTGDWVIESLNSTKLPMAIKDVIDYCDKNGFEVVDQRVIITKLAYLCRNGKIKRLAKGVYACLEFDGQLDEIHKTVCERIVETLQNYGYPMSNSEIVDNLNQGNDKKITLSQSTDILKYLCRKERVRRLDKGVYSCLEFKDQYKPRPVIAQPKEKKRRQTNISSSKPKPKAPAKEKEIKTPNKPSNDSDLESDRGSHNVSRKRPEKQKIMPIGSRINKIVKNWVGPITADKVIKALNEDGFRKVNPEIVRPFVETKLRRDGN